jgi:hypothetical protein
MINLYMKNTTKGFSTPVALLIILAAFGVGYYWFLGHGRAEDVPSDQERVVAIDLIQAGSSYLDVFEALSSLTVEGAEEESFVQLSSGYAMDTDQVWYLGENSHVGKFVIRELEGVEPSEFKILELAKGYEYGVYKDKVYHSGEELVGLDASKMELIDKNYISDGKHVFFTNSSFLFPNVTSKLEDVDTKTLNIYSMNTDQGFIYYGAAASDKNNVYFLGKLQKGLDGSTFQNLNMIYKKDANYVFTEHRGCNNDVTFDKIEGADAGTFVLIENKQFSNLAKDKNHVYLYGKIMEGVDPATVEVTEEATIIDKNGEYEGYSKDGWC